jgi:hypothetical protein
VYIHILGQIYTHLESKGINLQVIFFTEHHNEHFLLSSTEWFLTAVLMLYNMNAS